MGVEAEVERDGVEDVAEDAAVGEEENAGFRRERQALRHDPSEEGGFCGEGGEGMGLVWLMGALDVVVFNSWKTPTPVDRNQSLGTV